MRADGASGLPDDETAVVPAAGSPAREEASPSTATVEYVVVVHGMGRQRRNTTLREAIWGFARAAGSARGSLSENPISLGSTQPTRVWAEYAGITPRGTAPEEFWPREDDSGDNIRFVDAFWSDLTEAAVKTEAGSVEGWIRSVTNNLGAHDRRLQGAAGGEAPAAWVPFWLSHLLRLTRILLQFVRLPLTLIRRDLATFLFDDYLGDVQVYAECPSMRGRAIGRLHRLLDLVCQEHDRSEAARKDLKERPRREPRLTIVAHSLGSALAVDALCCASLPLERRKAIPGYEEGYALEPLGGIASHCHTAPKAVPPKTLAWVKSVDWLFTMGCPVEKMIALWPENWRPHTETRSIQAAGDAYSKRDKIRHANFVENGDVVADPLVLLRTSPLYLAVFDPEYEGERMEWVYTHGFLPFVAHVNYWVDDAVFKVIRDLSWSAPVHRPRMSSRHPRLSAQLVFELAPLAMGTLFAVLLGATLAAKSLLATVVFAGGLAAAAVLGTVLLRVLAWWWELSRVRSDGPDFARHIPGRVVWHTTIFFSAIASVCLTSLLRSAYFPLAAWGTGALLVLSWLLTRGAAEKAARRSRDPIDPKSLASPLATGTLPWALAGGLVLAIALIVLPQRMAATGAEAAAAASAAAGAKTGAATGAAAGAAKAAAVDVWLVVLAALVFAVGIWRAGVASSLPPEAQDLRRKSRPAMLSTWGLASILWAAWQIVGLLAAQFLRDQQAGRDAAGVVSGATEWVASRVNDQGLAGVAEIVFFWATGLAIMATAARYEVAFARASRHGGKVPNMDWRAWTDVQLGDYVSPPSPSAPS